MEVAFIVKLNIDDISQIPSIAEDLHDDLASSFDVISVTAWNRPTAPQINPGLGSGYFAPPPPL